MTPPAKKRLGELLIEAGVIDETQLKAALGHQRQWGIRLGQALVDLKLASEQDVVKVLARRFGFEVAQLHRIEPYAHQQALSLVPQEFALKHNVFPMGADTSTLAVAMSDPTNLAVVDELRFRSGRRVKVSIGGDREIATALQSAYDGGVEAISFDFDDGGAGGEPVLDAFGGGSAQDFDAFFGAQSGAAGGDPSALESPFAADPMPVAVPAVEPASPAAPGASAPPAQAQPAPAARAAAVPPKPAAAPAPIPRPGRATPAARAEGTKVASPPVKPRVDAPRPGSPLTPTHSARTAADGGMAFPAPRAAPPPPSAIDLELLPSAGALRDAQAGRGPGAAAPLLELEEAVRSLPGGEGTTGAGEAITAAEQAILAALQRLAEGGHAEPEVLKPTQAIGVLIRLLVRRGIVSERELLDALKKG